MRHLKFVLVGFVVLAVMVMFVAVPRAAAQNGMAAVEKAAAALAPKGWTPPRTPDGQPDLQGIYTNVSVTPLARPKELAGQEFFTGDEAVSFEKKILAGNDKDRRDGNKVADVRRAYNELFWDSGTKVAVTMQTSLVVDPPDGQIPAYTPAVQKEIADEAEMVKEKCADPNRVCGAAQDGSPALADTPTDFSLMTRCIVWPTSGPPMLPSVYDSNYQIVQTPGYVMIFVEAVHDVRIIPLDGRPHLPQSIRQLLGDSRGHWEGNTLVVDTTNFNDEAKENGRVHASRDMHLIERFTRVAPGVVLYEFTVNDPTTFIKPWSAAIPMTAIKGPIFEYACNEGNYGLANILETSRLEEKKRAEQTSHEDRSNSISGGPGQQ